MNLCSRTTLIAAAVTLMTCVSVGASDRESLTLDTHGIKAFRISAESGFLHIEGTETGTKIEVIAEHEGDRDNHRLSLKKDGDRALLISHIEDWPLGWGDERINLTVKVPAGLSLDIEDGSGEITLTKVNANTRIDDGSGSISISTHRGNIMINDGSGSIDVINVLGNVDIEDGSGSIEVSKVDGHVTIDDGSGSIDIDTVSKGVTIDDEGSGGLHTRNIKGGVDQHR
jgi:hypothetical protein